MLNYLAQGNYYDSEVSQPEPVKKEANSSKPFDPAMSANLDGLRQLYGADTVDGVMARAISDLSEGKDADGAVNDLAKTIEMEKDQGYTVANGILTRLQDSMFNAVEAQSGESGDEVSQWFFTKLSPDYRSHFLVRIYHGDRTAITDMVRIFKSGDHY